MRLAVFVTWLLFGLTPGWAQSTQNFSACLNGWGGCNAGLLTEAEMGGLRSDPPDLGRSCASRSSGPAAQLQLLCQRVGRVRREPPDTRRDGADCRSGAAAQP